MKGRREILGSSGAKHLECFKRHLDFLPRMKYGVDLVMVRSVSFFFLARMLWYFAFGELDFYECLCGVGSQTATHRVSPSPFCMTIKLCSEAYVLYIC